MCLKGIFMDAISRSFFFEIGKSVDDAMCIDLAMFQLNVLKTNAARTRSNGGLLWLIHGSRDDDIPECYSRNKMESVTHDVYNQVGLQDRYSGMR